jgi:hypothetical protein
VLSRLIFICLGTASPTAVYSLGAVHCSFVQTMGLRKDVAPVNLKETLKGSRATLKHAPLHSISCFATFFPGF